MNDVEVITTALGGLAALAMVLGWIGMRQGWLEGSAALRVVPAAKRRPAEKPAPAAEIAQLREAG